MGDVADVTAELYEPLKLGSGSWDAWLVVVVAVVVFGGDNLNEVEPVRDSWFRAIPTGLAVVGVVALSAL